VVDFKTADIKNEVAMAMKDFQSIIALLILFVSIYLGLARDLLNL
jgi:hypothetical protein